MEAAKAIYLYVRDEIKHYWVPAGQKASATIATRAGDCWPKAILQVAMLRIAGIPARFRWIEYHKQLFLGFVPPAVYGNLSDPFPFHVLAEAYLANAWVMADATFDSSLRPDRAHDWDGRTNYIALTPDEMSADLGDTATFEERIPQIEQFFGGSPIDIEATQDKKAVDMEGEIVNLYFDFVRFRNRIEETSARLLGS
jgi:Transglutaminase-like superfamily